ncbi:MAG: M20 family metallopeptidase [Rubripirellula sp.]|nr:M20 family metallopeptidase [Rubripirellula sp.]
MSVLETLADLIRIPSVNPNYGEGTTEAAVGEYVESFFRDQGIETVRQAVLPPRENIIAKLPGRDSNRRIVLEAHMDTVSTAGMTIAPFEPTIRNGRMHGRGACDTKAGLAAMMHAMVQLKRQTSPPPWDIWLAATVDEEFSYRGVVKLCSTLKADAAVVAEPTELRLVTASKGLVRFKVETLGRSAHSAKPHLGINSIEAMGRVIAAIEVDHRQLNVHKHPLLGPPTCNIGVIRGGVQINLVPAKCEIEVDRRLLPGETPDDVLQHYHKLIESLNLGQAEAVIHPPLLTDVPLETETKSPPVIAMQSVLKGLDLDPDPIGVPFCSDASKFGQIGIPAMIFGPGSIDQAHSAEEWVPCDQVELAVEIIEQFCRTCSD